MKTFKDLRNVQEQASPMIKPPKNEFGKKEDAFAHAKQHGGKVMKKTFTHPTSGMQTVSYVVREETEIDEASKKPNATTRHLRDYPVSDKEMAKPVAYYSLVHKATNKVLSTHKDLESAKDEHRGLDQGERAHYRIATSTKAPKSFDMTEEVEQLDELSPRLLDRAAKKASKNAELARDKGHDEAGDEHMGQAVRLRTGYHRAVERDRKNASLASMSPAKQRKYAISQKRAMGEEAEGVAEGLDLQEAEKNGKKVQLNKPFRTSDGKGKFAVYSKNEKGNVVKVNFGDTTGLTIKTSNPDRRRNFRARHNCDNPGPRHKARYWSCKAWSRGTVSAGLGT